MCGVFCPLLFCLFWCGMEGTSCVAHDSLYRTNENTQFDKHNLNLTLLVLPARKGSYWLESMWYLDKSLWGPWPISCIDNDAWIGCMWGNWSVQSDFIGTEGWGVFKMWKFFICFISNILTTCMCFLPCWAGWHRNCSRNRADASDQARCRR